MKINEAGDCAICYAGGVELAAKTENWSACTWCYKIGFWDPTSVDNIRKNEQTAMLSRGMQLLYSKLKSNP